MPFLIQRVPCMQMRGNKPQKHLPRRATLRVWLQWHQTCMEWYHGLLTRDMEAKKETQPRVAIMAPWKLISSRHNSPRIVTFHWRVNPTTAMVLSYRRSSESPSVRRRGKRSRHDPGQSRNSPFTSTPLNNPRLPTNHFWEKQHKPHGSPTWRCYHHSRCLRAWAHLAALCRRAFCNVM